MLAVPSETPGNPCEGKRVRLREPGVVEIGFADALRSRVHELVLRGLQARGLATSWLGRLDGHTLLGRATERVPLAVTAHLRVTASLAARTGLVPGAICAPPLIELRSERAELGCPLLNDDHVRLLGLVAPAELCALKTQAQRAGLLLREAFAAAELALDAVRLELGRGAEGLLITDVVLATDRPGPGPVPDEAVERLLRAPAWTGIPSEQAVTCELLVRPRAGSSDPQAEAIEEALAAAGFTGVTVGWVGRSLQLSVRAGSVEAARARVAEMCRALLCNPNLETYELRVEER